MLKMMNASNLSPSENNAPFSTVNPPVLLGLSGPATGLRHALKKNTVMGRGYSCDIRLEDPTLSWEHCTLLIREDGVYLKDNDSSNGTWIEDQEITEHRLPPGVIFHAGESAFRLEQTKRTIVTPSSQRKSVLLRSDR